MTLPEWSWAHRGAVSRLYLATGAALAPPAAVSA